MVNLPSLIFKFKYMENENYTDMDHVVNAVNHLREEEEQNVRNAKFNAHLFGGAVILLAVLAVLAKIFGV